MKRQYRISPRGAGQQPTDAEIARYKDAARLQYNYSKAKEILHRKPIHKDRRAFLVLVVIVLLAWLLSENDRVGPSVDDPQKSGTEENGGRPIDQADQR